MPLPKLQGGMKNQLPSPVDSIREATFTVSPKRQYLGIACPTTPAHTHTHTHSSVFTCIQEARIRYGLYQSPAPAVSPPASAGRATTPSQQVLVVEKPRSNSIAPTSINQSV